MKSILIKDTTKEERIRIVQQSLSACGTECEFCNGCMENAEPYLLSIADYITGHCNDAGFAQAIEKFVLS